MSFFVDEPHPHSEITKMSLGQMINMMSGDDPELRVSDYQRGHVWSWRQQKNMPLLGPVWSGRQQEGYLESLSKNMPLFGPVINLDTSTGIQWIMDGRIRIETIRRFLSGEIKYKSISFSELPDNEKRRIKNMKMSYTETRDWSREQCRDYFNFMRIQVLRAGEKLKDGELIHARTDNELTKSIQHILIYFEDFITKKANNGGLGFTPGYIYRFGHYEFIGTLIHMIRTNEYPLRPGKTALKEFLLWDDYANTPSRSQRETATAETKELLRKYSQITNNVARLKQGVQIEDHLRLMYFIYKSGIWREEMNENIYNRIDALLNRVLNRDNPLFGEIITLSGYNEEGIYDKYVEVYNQN